MHLLLVVKDDFRVLLFVWLYASKLMQKLDQHQVWRNGDASICHSDKRIFVTTFVSHNKISKCIFNSIYQKNNSFSFPSSSHSVVNFYPAIMSLTSQQAIGWHDLTFSVCTLYLKIWVTPMMIAVNFYYIKCSLVV